MKYGSLSYILINLCLVLTIISCTDLTSVKEVDASLNGEYAIPLINTKARIVEIAESTSGNAVVKVDPEGRLTVFYTAPPVQRFAREIFAPVDFPVPLFLQDTVAPVPFPVEVFPTNFQLDRAIFANVGIRWSFQTKLQETVTVKVTIPELSKDGVIYTRDYVLNYEGGEETNLITETESVDSWDVTGNNNQVFVNYDARNEAGERIELDRIVLTFDRLDFGYIEGFFGKEIQQVDGEVITVGVYSNWLSGGLWFENPKVRIDGENAFGFPVEAKFNSVEFTTITGSTFLMTGDLIDNGVLFKHPTLAEVGEVKLDTFFFNNENSNIQEIFNEKVSRVAFDIDAVANPEDDPDITGFMTSDSYYKVVTNVELPLFGYANELKLTDTFDIDFEGYASLESAEFKLIMENDFPFDVRVQGFLLDENQNITDSLFRDQRYFLPAADIDEMTGIATSAGEETVFIPFDETKINNVIDASKVVFLIDLESLNNGEESLWIYEDYALELRMGAKIKLND